MNIASLLLGCFAVGAFCEFALQSEPLANGNECVDLNGKPVKMPTPWLKDQDDLPRTMFHPTKAAIIRFLMYWAWSGKPITKKYLDNIIQYHFVNGTHYSKSFAGGNNIVETNMANASYVNRGGQGQVVNVIKVDCDRCHHPHIDVSFGIPNWPLTTARIVKPDIKCGNTLVHFVDKVFWFPRYGSATMRGAEADAFPAAVSAAALMHVLDLGTNITVFVPENKVLEALLGGANTSPATLKSVLLTHMAHGSFYSTGLAKLETITMLDGKSIKIELTDHTVRVGGAKVVLADVLLRNGVLHVVDDVLHPGAGTLK
jgi:uncharacterized surface protein with fasciclin (FAS1) repeats